MTNVQPQQAIELNLDKLREKGFIWIRRASAFMGIGTNAAAIRPALRHTLDDRAQFNFLPKDASEEEAIGYVDEFMAWTISNGLRELTEGHAGFLVNAYGPALVIATGNQTLGSLRRALVKFERGNVLEQRTELFALMGTNDDYLDMFESILQARNCLAHRNGVVGQKDVDVTGSFTFRWRFSGLHVGGVYLDLNKDEAQDIVVGDNGAVTMQPVVKTKTFQLGEQIRLTRHDLAEICLGFSIATEMVLKDLGELAQAKNVQPTP